MQLHLSLERQAELTDYARRHGQDPAAVLDQIVAEALASDRQDGDDASTSIRRAYESLRAGRTRPASVFLNELRTKHGF